MEHYFLLIEDKATLKTAFYNDKTMLVSSFTGDFSSISKEKTTVDSSTSLKNCLDLAVFVLNRYYFVSKAIVVDRYENTIFEIERNNLKDFLKFYKGDGI